MDWIGVESFESDKSQIFDGLLNQNILIVLLDPARKAQLCFKGSCRLGLIHGQVKLNGYRVRSSRDLKWYEIYSPETSAFQTIVNETPESGNGGVSSTSDQELNLILGQIGGSFNLNSPAKSKFREFLRSSRFSSSSCSLVAIAQLKSKICEYISSFDNFRHVYRPKFPSELPESSLTSRVEKAIDIFPIPAESASSVFVELEGQEPLLTELMADKSSDMITKEKAPILMACGGKDVGKSSFLRYLVNSLLNKYSQIAYIDCDPGQCEFTLGGCISLAIISAPLLGPPHTHISHSDKKCYFLGHLSPNDVPGLYLDLLKKCKADFKALSDHKSSPLPLIVNTMGWNQGLGLCLLKETMLLFNPTDVIQINFAVDANKNMPKLDMDWLTQTDGWPPSKRFKSDNMDNSVHGASNSSVPDYNLRILCSRVGGKNNQSNKRTNQKRFSPRDHRNLATMAYFSALQNTNSPFKSIHHLTPYRISWSKLGLYVSHTRISYDQLLRVFNASLVGLCCVESQYIEKNPDDPEMPGYLKTRDPKSLMLRCLGFGIVRGINVETKEFYILSPEPVDVLNQVNLLATGMLNLPAEFFFEQDSDSSCPYMSYAAASGNGNVTGSNDFGLITNDYTQRRYLIHQASPHTK